MKTGFKEPNKIKKQEKKNFPENGKPSSIWSFECPQYDQRSSCFVNAGTHYGVGINQPVGHLGNPKDALDTLPQGRVNTLETDYVG